MIKIPTLFKKDPADLSRVTEEVDPQNEWVMRGEGQATRKWDGTAAAIINGQLYKRYDVKKGRAVPEGAIPCQEPDPVTGHWPHWVLVEPGKAEDRYFLEALGTRLHNLPDGTYELCGPKVQGNPEGLTAHQLIPHGKGRVFIPTSKLNYAGIKEGVLALPYEGLVWHHPDGRMCKIRKRDFGVKREPIPVPATG